MTRDFTLEDIAKLIKDSENGLEERLSKKMDEKFQEAKDFTEFRFNWLSTEMMAGFGRLEYKMDEMERGLRREIRSNTARIEILEEKVL